MRIISVTILVIGCLTLVRQGALGALQPPPTDALREKGRGVTSLPRLVGRITESDAVRIALTRNLKAAIAREEAVAAVAERRIAASGKGVKASANVFGAAQNFGMIYSTAPAVMPASYTALPGRNIVDANLMAMVPLFTGDRLSALLGEARAKEKTALARTSFALVEAAREARVSYAGVVLARQRVETSDWSIAQQTENLALAKKRYAAGTVARYVINRAQADLARARRASNDATAQLVAADARFKEALGIDMTSDLQYEPRFSTVGSVPEQKTEMRAALAQRPDLIAARQEVVGATMSLRTANAAYSPQIYGVASIEGQNAPRQATLNGGYSVGIVTSIPILDAGERKAAVEKAKAYRRSRELAVQSLELEATREVTEAHATLRASADNVRWVEEEVANTGEDLRVARLRFETGRAIYLEVLEALNAASRARLEQIRARYEVAVARADMLRATGRVEEIP